MDNKQIAKRLKLLCQLDIDAIHAYRQAINRIPELEIKSALNEFEGDHMRHYQDLSKMIQAYGDNPLEFSKDFKGFLLEAFTSIRSVTGTEGALKAMRSGELITNKRYGGAVSEDFPVDLLDLLKRNYSDEQRHLNYIEQTLRTRSWEKKAA